MTLFILADRKRESLEGKFGRIEDCSFGASGSWNWHGWSVAARKAPCHIRMLLQSSVQLGDSLVQMGLSNISYRLSLYHMQPDPIPCLPGTFLLYTGFRSPLFVILFPLFMGLSKTTSPWMLSTFFAHTIMIKQQPPEVGQLYLNKWISSQLLLWCLWLAGTQVSQPPAFPLLFPPLLSCSLPTACPHCCFAQLASWATFIPVERMLSKLAQGMQLVLWHGWCGGTASNAVGCDAVGCCFMPCLVHLWSSFLLIHLVQAEEDDPSAWSPATLMKLLASAWPSPSCNHLGSESVNGTFSVSLFLPLCLWLTFQ